MPVDWSCTTIGSGWNNKGNLKDLGFSISGKGSRKDFLVAKSSPTQIESRLQLFEPDKKDIVGAMVDTRMEYPEMLSTNKQMKSKRFMSWWRTKMAWKKTCMNNKRGILQKTNNMEEMSRFLSRILISLLRLPNNEEADSWCILTSYYKIKNSF